MAAASPPRPVAWMLVGSTALMMTVLGGVILWRVSLSAADREIQEKRSALKKLTLSGGVPPNQEVRDYLVSRQAAIEKRYQDRLKMVTFSPPEGATGDEAQLYFRERSHELQRTLERLAKARAVAVPEQLGLPKELPPPDVVPPLLVQLTLMQEAATLMFDQGPVAIASLKIEEPEPVAKQGTEEPFLLRLPVRIRLSGSLPQMLKVLSALQRAEPMVDLRGIRLSPGEAPDTLDAEIVVARYLAVAPAEPSGEDASEQAPAPKRKRGGAS